MAQEKKSRQTQPRKTSKLDGRWFRYLKVRQITNDGTLFKFFLSKLIFTDEILSEEEIVMLFLVREKVLELVATDPEFKEKYFWLVFLTRHIFINLEAFCADTTARIEQREMLSHYFSHKRGQLSARLYFGLKVQFSIQMTSAEPKKPKAKNRIAVGYRDKGTARKPAWDGSPPWQEVAMDEWFQTHQVSKCNRSQAIEHLYESLRSKEVYRWQNRLSRRVESQMTRQMKG